MHVKSYVRETLLNVGMHRCIGHDRLSVLVCGRYMGSNVILEEAIAILEMFGYIAGTQIAESDEQYYEILPAGEQMAERLASTPTA